MLVGTQSRKMGTVDLCWLVHNQENGDSRLMQVGTQSRKMGTVDLCWLVHNQEKWGQ